MEDDCRRVTFAIEPERLCGLCAACRVLPPPRLHRMIVLAAAATRIAGLRVPIALEKRTEAVIIPVVTVRVAHIGRRLARHETALGLVAQHRDKFSAIVGFAAERLV